MSMIITKRKSIGHGELLNLGNNDHPQYLLKSGDTTTGDYNFDSGTLKIDSVNNRVGVGTIIPSSRLDVQAQNNSTQNYIASFKDTNGNVIGGFTEYGQFVARGNGASGAFQAYAGANKRMEMNSSGGSYLIDLYNVSDVNTIRLFAAGNSYFIGGNVGIGTTSPTAALHLKAGTTVANTAPLKLTTQASALTTPEQGTMELVGNSLQFTQLARRRGVAMSRGVITSTTTTTNTVIESTPLITSSFGANYLEVGKREETELNGMIAQRTSLTGILTIRIKYAGVTAITITTPANTVVPNRQYTLRVTETVRSIGVAGTVQINAMLLVSGLTVDPSSSALVTANTTIASDTSVTFQWGEANVANTISVEQGRVLCIEPNR